MRHDNSKGLLTKIPHFISQIHSLLKMTTESLHIDNLKEWKEICSDTDKSSLFYSFVNTVTTWFSLYIRMLFQNI